MTPTTDQLKDLLAKVTPGDWTRAKWYYGGAGYTVDGIGYCFSRNDGDLIALAPTLAAEVVRLRGIIEKVDQYAPVADDTCDEPGITFTEAIMRQWPELRPPSP